MKTFDDLQFRPWLEGRDMSPSIASFGGYDKARQAIMEFENGYGVSVLFGRLSTPTASTLMRSLS